MRCHPGVADSLFKRLRVCLHAVFVISHSLSWFMLPSRHRRGIIYADRNKVNSMVQWEQKKDRHVWQNITDISI